uniref:Uncharacterized protein n=1 Tax=Rhizophora mucronata TaxID=61149 RepID=A0A2P2NAC4_RHIMU
MADRFGNDNYPAVCRSDVIVSFIFGQSNRECVCFYFRLFSSFQMKLVLSNQII